MNIFGINILELLNTYGMPTTLAILFIWFYKQSSDRYTKFLSDSIKQHTEKEKNLEDMSEQIKKLEIAIDQNTERNSELQKTIMNYLLKGKE